MKRRFFFCAKRRVRVRVLARCQTTSLSFSAPSHGAGHFCYGKSDQNHCAGHDGFADIVSAQLPLVLAERQPRRTRPSLASDMRRLLCRSAVRRGVMQRRGEKLC
ncbi:MAG: hypothetical protein ACREPK_02235, partial [Rhodanobacteraceae bacterium]